MAVGRRAPADDGHGARQRRRASATFIATLADHGLAGVGLGTGFAHDTVPEALVEAARERGFPLFEVPYEMPFIAVTEQAFTRLVNEQYAVLQRSIAAQERLQRIVLSERGLDAIAGALATLVGGTALVFDGRGERAGACARSAASSTTRSSTALGAELRERARRGDGKQLRARATRDLAPRGARAAGRRGRRARPRRRAGRPGSSRSRTPAAWPSSTA